MDKKLKVVKERSSMNIKSGRVMMEVKDRDWLFQTIENLKCEVELLKLSADPTFEKALNEILERAENHE